MSKLRQTQLIRRAVHSKTAILDGPQCCGLEFMKAMNEGTHNLAGAIASGSFVFTTIDDTETFEIFLERISKSKYAPCLTVYDDLSFYLTTKGVPFALSTDKLDPKHRIIPLTETTQSDKRGYVWRSKKCFHRSCARRVKDDSVYCHDHRPDPQQPSIRLYLQYVEQNEDG